MHRIGAYVQLALIFIVIISILYLPVLFRLKKKGVSVIRQLSYLSLFCAAFLIIFATIFFDIYSFRIDGWEWRFLNLTPFRWLKGYDAIQQFTVEIIPNIMLFVPLGFFVPIVFKKMRRFFKTVLLVFLVTFSVEFVQYFIGRSSDIDDIITNLLGGMIGYGVFKISDRFLKKKALWNEFLGDEAVPSSEEKAAIF